jgi:carbonic anhydrase
LGLCLTGLVPGVTGATVTAAKPPAWNHDPGAATGPAHWGSLDGGWETCSTGHSQSPVELAGSTRADLPLVRLRYPEVPLTVHNTGHVIEVPQPEDSQGVLAVGADTYRLVQFHVHVPSEHTIRGRHADAEIHLVHRDAQGHLAVVAILANAFPAVGHGGRRPAGAAARLLREIVAAAPTVADAERDTGELASARELLPARTARRAGGGAVVSRYLTYPGSLTTPPCTEGVRWIVLQDTVRVSRASVDELHLLVSSFPAYAGYPDDNRPLQPLAGRTVLRRDR